MTLDTHRVRNELTAHTHRSLEDHVLVYHVGHLDEDRVTPHFSHEGGELSISHVPAEWRRITKYVGGTTYELSNPDGLFYAIEPETRVTDAEMDLCLDTGYTELVPGYRVDYESEDGDDVYSLYYTREDADEKLEWHPDAEITETQLHALASEGEAYWKRAFTTDPVTASPFQVRMLIPIWAASFLNVDGVYWHHPLIVNELSAPRGLIYQDRVSEWDQHAIGET